MLDNGVAVNLPGGTLTVDPSKTLYVSFTYEELRNDWLPFWSIQTVQRAISDLEKMGMLLSCRPAYGPYIGKYYTISEKAIKELCLTTTK